MASSTSGGGETNLGLAPNIAGLLCYVPLCCGIGVLFSVVAAIVEKQSRFVRFHAFQALLFHGVSLALLVGLHITQSILASFVPGPLSGLVWIVEIVLLAGLFAGAVFLMIKTNAGEEFELPLFGAMARQWV